MTLCSCYDPVAGQLDATRTADSLVALLYHLKYQNHVPSKTGVAQVIFFYFKLSYVIPQM